MHILDRCEKFLYGGCGGNHNNFYNASDCLAFCQGTQNTYINIYLVFTYYRIPQGSHQKKGERPGH